MPGASPETALARIPWQGHHRHLGVELVNHNREKFFLFAEVFLAMMGRSDEYVIVKHRDRQPERAINYHGGAIWGDVTLGKPTSVITLYFGALYQDITYCPESQGLRHVLGEQRYRVESAWLQGLAKTIERQLDESREFELLAREADVSLLEASFIGG